MLTKLTPLLLIELFEELLTELALLLLSGYKRLISPLLPPACRFTPTCSEYAMEAIKRFGIWRGGWLALCRFLRCHPFHPSGYDPVPTEWKSPSHKCKTVRFWLPFLLVCLLIPFAFATDWTKADFTELLKPPISKERAARDLTEVQTQLNLHQEKQGIGFARLKFREAVLLDTLNQTDEALAALDETVKAYQQEIKGKRNGAQIPRDFQELAVTAAYRKAQIIARLEGKDSRNVVKALEAIEHLLAVQGASALGLGSFARETADLPLWVWDEQAKEVRRHDNAYTVISQELDSIYRKGLNYQLFDTLVRLCGGNLSYSHGLAVILLALLLRILMHPLNRKAMRSMWKMQALQPKMKDLQERYKDDPKKLNAEVMKLYREHGVNPLGGCLPMLLQFPVLIWVYYGVLHYRFQFAKASFLWIVSLAKPDYPLFVAYLISFFASSWFMTTPSQDPIQRQQQIMMNVIFVVIFAMFFHSFPSAFILYWLAFQAFYIVESLWLKRRHALELLPIREVKPTDEGKVETKNSSLVTRRLRRSQKRRRKPTIGG